MKTVLLACGAYATFLIAPPLAFALVLAVSRRSAGVVHTADDLLLVLWFVGMAAALSTVGFGVVTALSARWRTLPHRRAMAIASAMGVVSPMASLAFSAATAVVMLPLLRSGAWWTAALPVALVGALLGGVAVLLERAWGRRDAAGPIE